jgi:hypothetical protein
VNTARTAKRANRHGTISTKPPNPSNPRYRVSGWGRLVGFPLWVNVVFTISSLVVFANADRIGTKPTLEPRFALYVEALSSPNPNHRAQAAGVLGQMQNIRRSQRPLLISHLEPLLRDPDTLVRTVTEEAIRRLRADG